MQPTLTTQPAAEVDSTAQLTAIGEESVGAAENIPVEIIRLAMRHRRTVETNAINVTITVTFPVARMQNVSPLVTNSW